MVPSNISTFSAPSAYLFAIFIRLKLLWASVYQGCTMPNVINWPLQASSPTCMMCTIVAHREFQMECHSRLLRRQDGRGFASAYTSPLHIIFLIMFSRWNQNALGSNYGPGVTVAFNNPHNPPVPSALDFGHRPCVFPSLHRHLAILASRSTTHGTCPTSSSTSATDGL